MQAEHRGSNQKNERLQKNPHALNIEQKRSNVVLFRELRDVENQSARKEAGEGGRNCLEEVEKGRSAVF